MPRPTEAMAAEARRGLAWRAEFGWGGTEIGVARARDIANQRDLSPATVRRMVSFFARHAGDAEAVGWRPGEPGFPSAGRIAWALWGGDPARSWGRRQAEEEKVMERKHCALSVKAEGAEIAGYGAVFEEVDLGGDRIARGAFARSLARRRPKMLRDHDMTKVIGVWGETREDERGLRIAGRLSDTPLGQETATLARDGALEGLSIGYRPVDVEIDGNVRVLKEIDLWEVSVVTFAMQPLAQIDAVKSLEKGRPDPVLERFVEAGLAMGLPTDTARAAAHAAVKKLAPVSDDAEARRSLAELLKARLPQDR